MAVLYSDAYVLAHDTAFIKRITMAMLVQATNIQAEASSTNNHGRRSTLARSVLNAPDTYAPLFAYVCATNTTILAATTVTSGAVSAQTSQDNDLAFTASSLWDALAGVWD